MKPRLHCLLAAVGCIVAAQAGPIVITQQPQSLVLFERTKARFAVDVEAGAVSPIFQWQRNGTNISGANEPVLITDYVRYRDNGDKFRVVISAEGQETITSQDAVLTVRGWDLPPMMIHAGRRTNDSSQIVVVFSTKLFAVDAMSLLNWSLDGGAFVNDVKIGRTESEFILTAENLQPQADYHLTVRNVRDQFGNAMLQQTILVTQAAPDPMLNVINTTNGWKMMWRVSNYLTDPFELEFSTNLARPELWYPTGSIAKDGDLRIFDVTLTGRNGFFRLRRLE